MYLNCIFSPIVVSLMAFLWPQHTDARITLTLCVMGWWRRSRRRSSSSNTSNGNVVLRFHLNYMSYWCVRFQVLFVASVVCPHLPQTDRSTVQHRQSWSGASEWDRNDERTRLQHPLLVNSWLGDRFNRLVGGGGCCCMVTEIIPK